MAKKGMLREFFLHRLGLIQEAPHDVYGDNPRQWQQAQASRNDYHRELDKRMRSGKSTDGWFNTADSLLGGANGDQKKKKVAIVSLDKDEEETIEIDGKEYFDAGHVWTADELDDLFRQHGVTHVDQRFGRDPRGWEGDGIYPVKDWIEWARSIE